MDRSLQSCVRAYHARAAVPSCEAPNRWKTLAFARSTQDRCKVVGPKGLGCNIIAPITNYVVDSSSIEANQRADEPRRIAMSLKAYSLCSYGMLKVTDVY